MSAPRGRAPRLTLEDFLLEEGLLDETALRQARRHARKEGVSLARATVEQGLSDEVLADLVARRLKLPRARLEEESVDDDALREVPFDLADRRLLLPLSIEAKKVIRVAMADPTDRDAVEEIEMSTGCQVDAVVARAGELASAAQRYYRGIITKTIPRRAPFGFPGKEAGPPTQPTHHVSDEAPTEVKLQALVDLLVERGVVEKDAWLDAIRRLMKERAGE